MKIMNSFKTEMEKIKQNQYEKEAERKAISDVQEKINYYKNELKKVTEETNRIKTKRQNWDEKYKNLRITLSNKKNELDYYVEAIEKTKKMIQEEQKKLDCTHNAVWKKRDLFCRSVFNFTERYRPSKLKKMLEYQNFGGKSHKEILDECNEKLFENTLKYEELHNRIKFLSRKIEEKAVLKK